MTSIVPALLRPLRVQQLSFSREMRADHGPSEMPSVHARAHAHGANPDRILLFGNGAAAAAGVAAAEGRELTLAQQLAGAVSDLTGRGIDVDVLADRRWDVESAAGKLEGRDLHGYDAVVITLGGTDAYRLLPPERWAEGLSAILDVLEQGMSAGSCVTVLGIPPISTLALSRERPGGLGDQWAERLNQLTRAVCEGRREATYLAVPNLLHSASAPERGRFHAWASQSATALAPSLDAGSASDGPARLARNRPQAEARRRAALWEMRLLDTPAERRFDEIVRHAQSLFGAAGAAFSIIDEKRQWNKSVVGIDVKELPIERSFCQTTIRSSDALVVEDAWTDERVPGDGVEMRFYAGYPIEAADGTRIGALCVFDEAPRPADSVDVTLLRDLALAIQRELEPAHG